MSLRHLFEKRFLKKNLTDLKLLKGSVLKKYKQLSAKKTKKHMPF